MKNLILIIGMFVATNAAAQLEVQEQKDSTMWERVSRLSPHLSIMVFEDDRHTIYFKNLKYQHITDIQYLSIGSKENLIQLLELCVKSCEESKEFKTDLYVVDSQNKKMAMVWITKGYFYISYKEAYEVLRILKDSL